MKQKTASKIQRLMHLSMWVLMVSSVGLITLVYMLPGNCRDREAAVISKTNLFDKYFYHFSDGSNAYSTQNLQPGDTICL